MTIFDFDQMQYFMIKYWNTALEQWIPWSMIAVSCVVFLAEACGHVRARYGRYAVDAHTKYGLKERLAWVIQESPSFFVALAYLLYRRPSIVDSFNRVNTNVILLVLFIIHYFQRSFIYSTRIRSDKNMGPMENLLTTVMCAVNGAQIGHYFTLYPQHALYERHFMIGTFLFLAGLCINIDSDNRLIHLRSRDVVAKKELSGYQIPHGGLFEYVSAANYFGECLEWFGFAIAAWSLPALAFCAFALSNLGPRAYQHHLFYKEKFGKLYPASRKAFIPFLI